MNKHDKFNNLYNKYSRLVYNIALKTGGCTKESAEDIVQNTFFIVYKKIALFDKKSEQYEKNLIASIAKAETINLLRKESSAIKITEKYQKKEVKISDFSDFSSVEIYDALNKLDEREQNIIILNFLYGFSRTEIAQIYGITKGRVSQIINSSLLKLKMEIKGGDKSE